MADASAGKVGLNVVPDFTGFGSLLSSGIRPALNDLQNLGKTAGKAFGLNTGTAIAAGLAAGGIAIAEFVRSGIQEFIQLGDQTRRLEQLTGDSAQTTSLFAGTIKALGGNVDTVSRGLGIFSANIAKQPKLFAEYGIEIAKTKQGNTDVLGTLDNLRQSFQGTGDATQRDAVAKQLLGRSYQQLLPYLSLTNDKLATFQDLAKDSGQVINQGDVDKVRELHIAMQQVTDEVDKLKLSAGREGTGLLANLLGNINDDPLRALMDALGPVTGNVGALQDLFSAHGNAASAARDQAAAEVDAKEAMQAMSLQATADANALNSIASAGEGVRTAQEGVASAADGVTQAERGVTSARESEARSAQGITKAEEGIQKARENTQRATEQYATAEQNLSDLLAKGPVDANAVEQAQRSLEQSARSLTDATQALADAELNLSQIQEFAAVDSANELTDARLKLSQANLQLKESEFHAATTLPSLADPFAQRSAQLAVAQAKEQQRQAQENLTKITQLGTQADKNLADAQKQVRDASQRVTDATTAQADASEKLAVAQAGDPEFQKKVAEAKKAVADAAIGVRDAENSERDAVQSLSDARQQQVDAHQSVVDAEDNVTKAKQRANDATIALRDAQYGLDDSIQKAIDSGADIGKLYDELAAKHPELIPILDQLKAVADSLVAVDRGVSSLAPSIAAMMAGAQPNPAIPGTAGIEAILGPALNPPGRASGGGVDQGWYTVGEHGPELLHAGGSGNVVSNAGVGGLTAAAIAQAFAGLSFVVTLDDGTVLGRASLRSQANYRNAFAGRQ